MTRANRKKAVGISLFPFLAVLICTMGSLVMLLVLLMQQARGNAVDAYRERLREATDGKKEQNEQLRIQVEDETWRAEVLQEQRQQLQEQVNERQRQLAYLEQQIRKLDTQWKSLQAQANEIAQLRETKSADIDPLMLEKQRIEEELAEAEQQLDEVRRKAAEAPRSYAIIPYPGPNGTTRRPIYIECTDRGVILQPENIVLVAEDFREPLGPGNPLDAAIRTIQDHQKRAFAQEASESYPLLIVRPDGVAAYAAARAAMSSWEDEFGYELVDHDLNLTYPSADPGLSTALQETIHAARQRQEIRRQAMPASRYSGTSFVVSAHHGGLSSLGGEDIDTEIGSGPGLGIGNGTGGTAATGAAASNGGHQGHGNQEDGNQEYGGPAGANREGGNGTSQADSASASASGSSDGNNRGSGARSGGSGNGTSGNGTSGNGTSGNGTSGSGGAPGGVSIAPSLAGSRGADWAVRKKTATATGYRRPVRVICREDALILVPEALSGTKAKVFRFEGDDTKTVDEFVKSLHQRMELWGLPPLNGFWKPQLVVEVEASGDERYELLEHLLHNSGLELKRETR